MDDVGKDFVGYIRSYLLLLLLWPVVALAGFFLFPPPVNLCINFFFFLLTLPFVLHLVALVVSLEHPKISLFILAPGALLAECFAVLPLKFFQRSLTNCLSFQGLTLTRFEEFDEAEKISERLIKMHGDALSGVARSSVAIIKSSSARARGDYTVAEQLARQQIARKKASGSSALEISAAYADLGIALAHQGKGQEAIGICERAVSLIENEKTRAGRTILATAQNNLGMVHSLVGNTADAEKYYTLSRDGQAELYGPSDWHVGLATLNMAGLMLDVGDYAAAADHAQKAEEIFKKTPGLRKVLLAGLATAQGEIERHAGNLDAAENHLQKSLRIYAKAPEQDDIDELHFYLGRLYASKGDRAQAAKYYQLSLDRRLRLFGPDHPKTTKIKAECQPYLT